MIVVVAAAVAVAGWLGPMDAQEFDHERFVVEPIVVEERFVVEPIVVEDHRHAYAGMGSNQVDWSGLIIAHFPESQLTTALRIIACESGGNPGAHNPSGASGLFQVMPFWADHLGIPRDALFDPSVNAEVAHYVWSVQGWDAWSCY